MATRLNADLASVFVLKFICSMPALPFCNNNLSCSQSSVLKKYLLYFWIVRHFGHLFSYTFLTFNSSFDEFSGFKTIVEVCEELFLFKLSIWAEKKEKLTSSHWGLFLLHGRLSARDCVEHLIPQPCDVAVTVLINRWGNADSENLRPLPRLFLIFQIHKCFPYILLFCKFSA